MVVLGQCGGGLGGLGLDVAIELHVDGVVGSALNGLGDDFWGRGGRSLICELLLDLQVGVDGVHAEVEIRAVLLVVLGANVRTRFLGWGENVGRGATLNGHDNNYCSNGNIVISCRHAKAGEIRSSSAQIFFSPHFFLLSIFSNNFVTFFARENREIGILTGGLSTRDDERASFKPMLNSVELILLLSGHELSFSRSEAFSRLVALTVENVLRKVNDAPNKRRERCPLDAPEKF